MKIKRICKQCGIEFEVYPYKIKENKGKFCSRSCAIKSRIGNRASRWNGGKTKRICKQCGKEFEVTPAKVKNGRGIFCSLNCYRESRKGVKCVCKYCNKVFEVWSSRIKNGSGKFCSQKCYSKWQSKHRKSKDSANWQGGISFEPYCHKFNEEFKEYIRAKFGRVCFLCPKTEEENGQRLSVHHVNYNKNCGCDEDETCQFVPLCRSCNSKVNKNRKEWEIKIKKKMRNKLNGWFI